jgi:hypothetical protein
MKFGEQEGSCNPSCDGGRYIGSVIVGKTTGRLEERVYHFKKLIFS